MMQKIQTENFSRGIRDQEKYDFTIDADGVYLIVFSARCKNWLQNFRRLFDDDDLALQVDDYLFAEVKGKKREFSSAGSWNGNELKGRTKDIFVILPLKKGVHSIKFWAGGQPFLEKVEIYKIGIFGSGEIDLVKPDSIKFSGFRDVIFKNLAVSDLMVKAKAEKSDRLELKIDGKTQLNPKYKRYAKWFWYGQELQGAVKEYKASYCFEGGIHSLEFRGQGQPKIESIIFELKDQSLRFKIGKIRLYKDITPSDIINLRSIAFEKDSEIITQLKDGDEVEITNERVVGEYIGTLLTDIWHEVSYKDKKGFVLSSFIEIEGQEREKIIDLIKEKCRQHDIDANIMLAIAGRESHYKPFARSDEYRRGIFQLGAGAVIDVEITDPYDFFQNIDGGVRYYKIIEKQFTGRGNILEWRLLAWHDGPAVTRKKKTINYDELSPRARGFLKNVLENYKRKDWFHISFLPLSILIVIFGFLTAYSFQPDQKYADVGYSLGQIVSSIPESENKDASLYSEKTPSFPEVFLDRENNEVVFINSDKTEVGRIEVKLLNLDGVFETPPDFIEITGRNSTFIEPQYLEYPKNVFYFFAATSATCGANNCTFAFFRFDSNNEKLELISQTLFGGIRALYLSPNFQKLALFATDHGGVAAEDDHICIFDLPNFKKQDIDDYFDWKFNDHYIEKFLWKNDNEIEFTVRYSKVPDPIAKRTIWLYNIEEGKSREVKSELFDLNMSG